MSLTRDEILNAHDLPTDYVDIPRWGGQVKVKGAPVKDRRITSFVNSTTHGNDRKGRQDGGRPYSIAPPSDEERQVRLFLATVIVCAIDEDGKPLFTFEDADSLREKHWLSVVKVAEKAWELASDEEEAVGSIEEGKASSPKGPTSD